MESDVCGGPPIRSEPQPPPGYMAIGRWIGADRAAGPDDDGFYLSTHIIYVCSQTRRGRRSTWRRTCIRGRQGWGMRCFRTNSAKAMDDYFCFGHQQIGRAHV